MKFQFDKLAFVADCLKSGLLVIGVLLFTNFASAESMGPLPLKKNTLQYQVSRGDTLANVLRGLGYQNLWGPKGDIAKVLRLNRKILNSKAELTPGQWIYLPSQRSVASTNQSFNQSGDLITRQPQSVVVTCPNGRTISSTATYIPPASPNSPGRLMLEETSASCSDDVARSPAAAPLPLNNSAQGVVPLQPDPYAVVEPMPPSAEVGMQSPTFSQKPAEAPVSEEPLEELAPAPAAVASEPLPHESKPNEPPPPEPWLWSLGAGPLVGYRSQIIESTRTQFSTHQGYLVGGKLDIERGKKSFGLGLGVQYETAPLLNAGVSNDRLNRHALLYRLHFRVYRLFATVAYSEEKISSSPFGGLALKFKDSGWIFGVGYKLPLTSKWSLNLELRNSRVEYRMGRNPELFNSLTQTAYDGFGLLEYRWNL